jgi:hypothetical protein
MAQQTAVEYYADKQLELHLKLKDNQILMMDFVVQSRDLLIESKEMEKQQIVKAWHERGLTIVPRYFLKENIDGEQYYTKTYNNETR